MSDDLELYLDLAEQGKRIEELEKACAEWAEVSQSNYQRAKAAEAKLAMAVDALRGWIDFANKEGMPVLLSDLEAAELTSSEAATKEGGKDEWKCPINYTGCTKNCGSYGCGN